MKVSDLKDYKDSLYSALCRDISEFEKNFLLISGGLLAFSITFIKEIIKISEAQALFLLFIGWGLIIISIAIMMYAFLKSAAYSDKLWKETDDFLILNQLYQDELQMEAKDVDEIKTKINILFYNGKKFLKRIRYCAVLAFILGLGSFALFVGINLISERKISPTTKSEKSVSIKTDDLDFISNDSSLNFKYDSKINGDTAKASTSANP
jgi:hypothetical protein